MSQKLYLNHSNSYRNNLIHYKQTCKKCKWRKTGSLHQICLHCLQVESFSKSNLRKIQKELDIS